MNFLKYLFHRHHWVEVLRKEIPFCCDQISIHYCYQCHETRVIRQRWIDNHLNKDPKFWAFNLAEDLDNLIRSHNPK